MWLTIGWYPGQGRSQGEGWPLLFSGTTILFSQPFSMVEMRAFLLPVPHPQEIRVPQKSAAVTTVCSISKGIFNSGPWGLSGDDHSSQALLIQPVNMVHEHPLHTRQVLNAEDTEVSETGYNCKAARHLQVKVCARCHISRRWGWNSQWEV